MVKRAGKRLLCWQQMIIYLHRESQGREEKKKQSQQTFTSIDHKFCQNQSDSGDSPAQRAENIPR